MSGNEASPLVVLVVGSTAGHVYPALSVAEEFSRRPSPPRLLFVSGGDGLAVRLLADAGHGVAIVQASPIKRAPGRLARSGPCSMWRGRTRRSHLHMVPAALDDLAVSPCLLAWHLPPGAFDFSS